MTKERLIEAIALYDPDGDGVDRVIRAAENNELVPSQVCGCLLAVAWSNNEQQVIVRNFTFRFFEGHKVGPSYTHNCLDVVVWFDAIAPTSLGLTLDVRRQRSCQAVLELLIDD